MTTFEAGQVVLVHYPFTDLLSTKKRPAVIVSPNPYAEQHGDIVAIALTGQRQPRADLAISDWKAAGLIKPTWVKPIIGTLSTSLIERVLGRVQDVDGKAIRAAIEQLLDARWLVQ